MGPFEAVPMFFFLGKKLLGKGDDGPGKGDGVLMREINRPGKILICIDGFTAGIVLEFHGF